MLTSERNNQGISLTIDQYKALLKAIPEINAGLKKGGIDVGASEVPDNDVVDEGDVKRRRKAEAKREKSNIEETSEEDEG